MTRLFPPREGQCGASVRRDSGAARSRRGVVCQCEQKTMALAEEQSPVGACCFHETQSDKGSEFGACAEDLRAVGPFRPLVTYRKHRKRQLTGFDLVCVTVPGRPCCAPRSFGSIKRHDLVDALDQRCWLARRQRRRETGPRRQSLKALVKSD